MGIVKELIAGLEGVASQAFRQSELLALLKCLKGEADVGLFGVLTCSSLAISPSGSTVAEFDGVYSIVTSNRSGLYSRVQGCQEAIFLNHAQATGKRFW